MDPGFSFSFGSAPISKHLAGPMVCDVRPSSGELDPASSIRGSLGGRHNVNTIT